MFLVFYLDVVVFEIIFHQIKVVKISWTRAANWRHKLAADSS
jgi:hypothetical protein